MRMAKFSLSDNVKLSSKSFIFAISKVELFFDLFKEIKLFFYFLWSEINLQTNKSTENQLRKRFFYFIYNLWRFAS